MYMSMRRYNVDPAKADKLFETVEREFGPVIEKMPGFVNYSVFDSGEGVVGSISIFVDKAAVDASNAKAAEWVGQEQLGRVQSDASGGHRGRDPIEALG